jgi:hypothetical protein
LLSITRRLTSDSIPIAWSSSRRWNSRKKAQKTQKKKGIREAQGEELGARIQEPEGTG